VNFTGAKVSNCHFRQACLGESDMRGAIFSKCEFTQANFEDVIVDEETQFIECSAELTKGYPL